MAGAGEPCTSSWRVGVRVSRQHRALLPSATTTTSELGRRWAAVRRRMAAYSIVATSHKPCAGEVVFHRHLDGRQEGGEPAQAGGRVFGDALGVTAPRSHGAHQRPGPRRHTQAAGADAGCRAQLR